MSKVRIGCEKVLQNEFEQRKSLASNQNKTTIRNHVRKCRKNVI